MLTILEGQISFGGIQDALEAVSRHKDVKNGLLKISSQGTSGSVGLFCGRFITGAKLTLTEEMGYEALRKLLSVKDGNFAFYDVGTEQEIELRQSLAVDMQLLLQSRDFNDGVPLSSESLTGMSLAATDEQIDLIDTSAEYSGDEFAERLMPSLPRHDDAGSLSKPEDSQGGDRGNSGSGDASSPISESIEQTEAQRSLATDFDEITMDRVPPHPASRREAMVTDSYAGEPADSGIFRRRPNEAPRPIVIPAGDEIPPPRMVQETAGQSAEDYKRTRDWSQKRSLYRNISLVALAAAVIAGAAFLVPKLGKIGGITGGTTVKPHSTAKPVKGARHQKPK